MSDSTAQELVHDTHSHPTWKTYVAVGAILTFITAIEVVIYYVPSLHGVIVPILLSLSALKFLIVVLMVRPQGLLGRK